jgi:tRNA uridine 5-carboxymethylaminomethyl modification enzyme
MFTSRAEFRLHLRIDNADQRLTPHGRRVGLISDAAWDEFLAKQERLKTMKRVLETTRMTAEMADQITAGLGDVAAENPAELAPGSGGRDACPPTTKADLRSAVGVPLGQLLKRPEIRVEQLVPVLREIVPGFFVQEESAVEAEGVEAHLSVGTRAELKSVETEVKYAGYLDQQQKSIERLKKAEQRRIPDWFDYQAVSGLSREMQEKLVRVRPHTLGHASRIPGVTPAAVSLINVYIEIQGRKHAASADNPVSA